MAPELIETKLGELFSVEERQLLPIDLLVPDEFPYISFQGFGEGKDMDNEISDLRVGPSIDGRGKVLGYI